MATPTLLISALTGDVEQLVVELALIGFTVVTLMNTTVTIDTAKITIDELDSLWFRRRFPSTNDTWTSAQTHG